MSKLTFYVQECPTCGRSLEIRVEYLGKKVACQHCSGRFVARDPSLEDTEVIDPYESLLRRVDQLLAQTPDPTARSIVTDCASTTAR